MTFCSRDLKLDLMTLRYETNLDVLKKVPSKQKLGQGFRKLQPKQTGTQNKITKKHYGTPFMGGKNNSEEQHRLLPVPHCTINNVPNVVMRQTYTSNLGAKSTASFILSPISQQFNRAHG